MNERAEFERGGELELVDTFEARALAIAASAAAPNTRRAYARAYRMFVVFPRAHYGEASLETFTVDAVAARRDELQAQGLARARSQNASAPSDASPPRPAPKRSFAQVRCSQVQHGRLKALLDRELSALLARPDLCTTIGTRDRDPRAARARDSDDQSSPETITARPSDALRRSGARPPARGAPSDDDRAGTRRADPA